MHLTEEQLSQVEEMAYRLITPGLIAINIEVDEDEFTDALSNPGNEIRIAYYKGLIRQESDLRDSIIKAAHNGSNPAQEQLLKMINKLISTI